MSWVSELLPKVFKIDEGRDYLLTYEDDPTRWTDQVRLRYAPEPQGPLGRTITYSTSDGREHSLAFQEIMLDSPHRLEFQSGMIGRASIIPSPPE